MANELIALIKESSLEKTEGEMLLNHFQKFFTDASAWEKKAKSIQITSVDQKAEMKMAREARLALKTIRVETDKKRKSLKEASLRKGQTIDAIAKIITNTIEPIETYLEEQEKFVEIQEEKRREEVKQERLSRLKKLGFSEELTPSSDIESIKDMNDEDFETFFSNFEKQVKEAKEQAEKEEKERIEKEKENERIRLENEKMKAEMKKKEEAQKKKDEEAQKERDAAEKEKQRLQAEIDKKEQEKNKAIEDEKRKYEEKMNAEKKRLEDEEKRKEEAERKEKEKQNKMNTKEHFKLLAQFLSEIDLPDFQDDEKYTEVRTIIQKQNNTNIKRLKELSI